MSEEASSAPTGRKPFKWTFRSAAPVILLLVLVGEAVGRLSAGLPKRLGGPLPLELRDWLVFAFLFFTAGWAWFARAQVLRFFRSMPTGVTLVSLSTLAVGLGVLVPQMSNFEDPDQRVTRGELVPGHEGGGAAHAGVHEHGGNYEEEYRAFAWAEGYFLYHLAHLYGIGLPEGDIPHSAVAGLDEFGKRYGKEERDNREKRMSAAFSGGQKTEEIRRLITENDRGLRLAFDVSTALHLNRLYKSSWFATLLTLLGIAIFSNTFTGPPRSWFGMQRIGFFVTHLGMMTLLAGGGISNWFTARGILQLYRGQPPQDQFYLHYQPDKAARLPFKLKLERFARQDWKQVMVHFEGTRFSSQLPTYTLWPGRVIDLDYRDDDQGVSRPSLRLEVLELYERAEIGPHRLVEAPTPEDPAGEGPMVELRVRGRFPDDGMGSHGHGGPGFDERVVRVPGFPGLRELSDPAWRFRLVTSHGSQTPERLAELFPPDDSVLGWLHARDRSSSQVDATPVPVRLGESFTAPGGYRIEVREATASFELDRETVRRIERGIPLAEQYPRNPALVVRITPPAGFGGDAGPGYEDRTVLEAIDPESTGLQSGYRFGDLVLNLEWDEWTAPGPPRHVLHWAPGGEAFLLSQDRTQRPVVPGEPLPLDSPTEVVPTSFYQNARIEQDIRFLAPHPVPPGGVDLDFYSDEPRGLVLQVTRWPGSERESVEVVELATAPERTLANSWRPADRSFEVFFFENTSMMPFEWRSVLSVWEEDETGRLVEVDVGPERKREIRVNDYFHHRGYRFFQTDANPNRPDYSGIGVVYDPGIPVVLIGMYTIILGTTLAFLVRPIVRSRRKAGRP